MYTMYNDMYCCTSTVHGVSRMLSKNAFTYSIYYVYSGPSEIGTQYNTLLYKGPKNLFPNTFSTSERGHPQDTTSELILSPKCPLFRGSTLLHWDLTEYPDNRTFQGGFIVLVFNSM